MPSMKSSNDTNGCLHRRHMLRPSHQLVFNRTLFGNEEQKPHHPGHLHALTLVEGLFYDAKDLDIIVVAEHPDHCTHGTRSDSGAHHTSQVTTTTLEVGWDLEEAEMPTIASASHTHPCRVC